MCSARKTAANRENSKKSTGPKSAEGRNVVRRNALKHGLTAETLVVEGADAEAFRQMAESHLAVFRPRNDVELELAKTFTVAAWRRQRCVSTETAMVNQHIRETQHNAAVIGRQDVLALGDRLFHDSQGCWQLFPDPSMKDCPISPRTNDVPGGPDLPARLVNELESSYEGCRWLLDRWNELRARAQKGNFWQAYDKFKCIRLMGRQPLDVLEDTTGDLLTMFLASDALYPVNKSPFSELRCEVADDQYPTVRRRLEVLSVEMERGMPHGDDAAICILEDLIDWYTQPLEQLALKHKARALAEAAEATRRLAFDPGAAADKVRRYEDASIRRMTRACDDLAKLRRSGMFDEDQPAAYETGSIEASTPLDESGLSGAAQASETTSGGWGPSPEGDAPSSEASALGACRLSPARPQPPNACQPQRDDLESCSPAAAQAFETTVDGSPAPVYEDRPGSDENTEIASEGPPEEPRSAAAAQAPETTVHGPRSTLNGNTGPWNALLLAVCFWLSLAQNKATAICTGRAGSAGRLTVTAASGKQCGESVQAGDQRPRRCGPDARNKATAVGSDLPSDPLQTTGRCKFTVAAVP